MLQIVSASYGPASVGRQQRWMGSSSSSSPSAATVRQGVEMMEPIRADEDEATCSALADTRDVTSFVRALLLLQHQRDAQQQQQQYQPKYHHHHQGEMLDHLHVLEEQKDNDGRHTLVSTNQVNASAVRNDSSSNGFMMVRIDAFRTTSGMKRTIIPLLEGKSMNEAFGDPCPGTSKKLQIHYQVLQQVPPLSKLTVVDDVDDDDDGGAKKKKLRLTQDFHESFAEHERVVLRLPALNLELGEEHGSEQLTKVLPPLPSALQIQQSALQNVDSSLPWGVWEIVLPMALPFLEIRERVTGRLVSRVWQTVVQDWGVAQSIDWTDREAFPNNTFTCAMLRGLLRHSYFSLTSLYLANLHELSHDDLAPAIPDCRRLRSLDVSGCHQLDDSTLQLLAQFANATLQVLYLKSLNKVTDQGIVAICQSCHQLRVLDISNLHALTDEGAGMAIGENLTQLRALYLRDNYRFTNQSIDIITEKCTFLTQLTLWGCIKLQHLSFEQPEQLGVAHRCGNLVVLNLWGCHNLRNDAANALGNIKQLRSLIVSECHRLTDQFLVGLTQNTPQLNHLHLRYCKKVTDNGVNAIAASMSNLFSLDLSFCTRINMASIVSLLEMRRSTLSELRLQSCHQLTIRRPTIAAHRLEGDSGEGLDGQALLDVLGQYQSCLNLLDLRGCGGQSNLSESYPPNDTFVLRMQRLMFQQKVPGFFARPASWDSTVQVRLADLLRDEAASEMDDT